MALTLFIEYSQPSYTLGIPLLEDSIAHLKDTIVCPKDAIVTHNDTIPHLEDDTPSPIAATPSHEDTIPQPKTDIPSHQDSVPPYEDTIPLLYDFILGLSKDTPQVKTHFTRLDLYIPIDL